MATQYVKVTGFISWPKVYEEGPDDYNGVKRYTTAFHPENEAQKKKIVDSGCRLTFKSLDPGAGYGGIDEVVRFKRDLSREFSGNTVFFTPPIISGEVSVAYFYEGEEGAVVSWDEGEEAPKRVGEPVMIGNGSKAEITFSVYDTRMGKGTRLEEINILELKAMPERSKRYNHKASSEDSADSPAENKNKPPQESSNEDTPW